MPWRLALADAATDKRFVLVVLRGGLDGLAAVAPYGDRGLSKLRKNIALPPPGLAGGVLDLDGFFALHPALAVLEQYYRKEQFAVVHAVASPYRDRSHFDAQNLLENGTDKPHGANDGWLNRALHYLGANTGRPLGMTVGQQIPLVLQGAAKVASWEPSGRAGGGNAYMENVKTLYRADPPLEAALLEGLRIRSMASESMGGLVSSGPEAGVEAAGAMLVRDDGPRIAVLEFGGWDTHAGQGASDGALAGRLSALAGALDGLARSLGAAWTKTMVVAVTEFGRTAHENGTNGTDHGTASCAFVMGGAMRGGKVYGRWPGLRDNELYEGRDLAPVTDMRALFKTALYAHLGLDLSLVENHILPGSGFVPVLREMSG